MERHRLATPRYWLVVAALSLFGLFGIASIGMPFLLLGLTLAAVAPWRNQPAVLWPAVTGVTALIIGYLLVAPLGCTTTVTEILPPGSGSTRRGATTCSNVLGIDYRGAGSYRPSLVPALMAGLALSVLAAAGVRLLLRPRTPLG